jgi:hypothetical protein
MAFRFRVLLRLRLPSRAMLLSPDLATGHRRGRSRSIETADRCAATAPI